MFGNAYATRLSKIATECAISTNINALCSNTTKPTTDALGKSKSGRQSALEMYKLKRWWYTIRPFTIEWANLKRKLKIFPSVYMVRFSFIFIH